MTSNKEEILETLKRANGPLNTKDLAYQSGIDVKNITRYLKDLESEGLVERKTLQIGKIRLVKVSLRTVKPIQEEKKIEKIVDEVKINHNIAESVRNGKRPTPLHLLQELDLELLLTGANNYLMIYRKEYQKVTDNPLSEVKRKYERFLKEKEKIEVLLR